MKRVGIFGGTFSPPHNGHVEAAKAFIDELSLDKLIVIPTNIPPHKTVKDNDPISRLKMAELAFSDIPKAEVSDYEIKRSGTSYTADTLTHFRKDDTSLFFLCGTDMFLTLKDWYRPDVICSLASIVLIRRNDGMEEEIKRARDILCERFSASVIMLESSPVEISSTKIRNAVSMGEDISRLVPEKVKEYIYDRGLYKKG